MRGIVLAAAVACLLGTPLAAQERPGTVATHATARVRLPNTVADGVIGIEAHGRTVALVQKALAEGSGALMASLRGVGAERLRTLDVSLTPETETPPRGGAERIVGYTGRVRVGFRVAAEKLPELLGAALDRAGINLEGTVLLPRESEVDAARQSLAANATQTAMAQARAVAEAAGRRLGMVRQLAVNPGQDFSPQQSAMLAVASAAARAPAAPVATAAGETEVTATVTVMVDLIEP